jgi:hypothetical protein
MALMLAWLVSGTRHVLYVYVQVRCLNTRHFVAGFHARDKCALC